MKTHAISKHYYMPHPLERKLNGIASSYISNREKIIVSKQSFWIPCFIKCYLLFLKDFFMIKQRYSRLFIPGKIFSLTNIDFNIKKD